MRLKLVSIVAIFTVTLAFGPLQAADYKLDPAHTSVIFKAKHANIGWIYGMFLDFSGSATFSPDNPGATSMNLELQTDSLFTNVRKRDDHLKGPDFFNAEQFPTITFETTSVSSVDQDTLRVTGDLTLHGVTKEITTEVELTGAGKGPQGNFRRGFRTNLTIDRMAHKVSYMPNAISKEIPVTVSGEFIRK